MIRRSSAERDLLIGPEGRRCVYLLDTSTKLETKMLERWIRANVKGDPTIERITSSRRGTGGDRESLRSHINAGDDPFFHWTSTQVASGTAYQRMTYLGDQFPANKTGASGTQVRAIRRIEVLP